METKVLNPMAVSRSRRVHYHRNRKFSVVRGAHSEQYNYSGTNSVTILLTIVAVCFGLFMYSMVVS